MQSAFVIIAIAMSVVATRAATATGDDTNDSRDYADRVAELVRPLQRNGWHGWKPGTVVVTEYLKANPKSFTSYSKADLIYTIGNEDSPLTRDQLVDGKEHRQHLNRGRSSIGPIGKPKMHPHEGIATSLTIDGHAILCIRYSNTYHVDLGGGSASHTSKQWILADHPDICIRWESDHGHTTIRSIASKKTAAGITFTCVVLETQRETQRGTTLETQYLNPAVPGFVVEEILDITSRPFREKKPLRIHQAVKSVLIAK